ncbi:class I SAM-dependent methyltransferase [Streptomyces parvulus]|uniref:class I SAM-dependent methyltransferase n=1 Tax=Streptomyces parvulus TaxID=146923 RepID=UPI001E284B96|nr:class I SAM-dependent methyltransferase [Streptomyces parvulus]MCC9153607.1 class I SAM-dependent methyltransferase [Streptomyces parvulus]MCE7687460.1 class I SAM-dependent methyltransferase [Streptomyces parvulus]
MSGLDIAEPRHLAASNLFYRDPALYDRVQSDSTSASTCRALVERHHPDARTLLDLGCGTGRDLELLAHHFDCIGVEVQPGLVDYARRTRTGLDIRLGDMRTIRLDHTADVLTCLGNSLSYVHDNQDIQAVFRTFAAHARPETLLVLCCSVAPIERDEPQETEVETGSGTAQVTITYEWDLRAQTNTTRRHWVFDSGEETRDVIRRRVLGPRELELYAALAGFDVLQITDGIGAGTLHGPTAYTVARYR